MKKFLAVLIVIFLLVSLFGCNIKKKISDGIAEDIIENASGADVDIDGDTITVQGTDGSVMTIGGTEWPDSDLSKLIPKCKDGTVSYVMESDGYLYITVDDISREAAQAYVDEVKKDFSIDSIDMNDSSSLYYTAKNADDVTVSVSFSDTSLMIIVGTEA